MIRLSEAYPKQMTAHRRSRERENPRGTDALLESLPSRLWTNLSGFYVINGQTSISDTNV